MATAPVFFAFGGLLLDGHRTLNVYNEAQSFVDRAALASAMELDGRPGAINRAIEAACGPNGDGPLVTDTHTYGRNGDTLVADQLLFLAELDNDPLPPDEHARPDGDVVLCRATCGSPVPDCSISEVPLANGVADADDLATFVEVVSQPIRVNYALWPVMRAFGVTGAATESTVTAFAVAGFTRAVCDSPPLMVCNPYEDPSNPGGPFHPIIGQQIEMKAQGPGTGWMPGVFGLLRTDETGGEPYCTGGGANRTRCVLALVNPNTVCVSGTVDVKPGELVSVHDGLNARFDIWDGPISGFKNNAAFAPSANVTKGKVHGANQCGSNQLNDPPPAPNNTTALPRDPCYATGTCAGGSADGSPRFGDGTEAHWSGGGLNPYWGVNHGDGVTPAAPPQAFNTRFEAYRYELENAAAPDKQPVGENGAVPSAGYSCAPDHAPVSVPGRDRRTLIMAVVNCIDQAVQGSADDVEVEAWARVFITEPIERQGPSTDKNTIWGELIGVVEPDDGSGVLHEFPVLYR